MGAHGTWKQTGGGGDDLLKVIAIIGAVVLLTSGALAGAVAAVVSFLEILALCAVGFAVIAAVAGFLLWRKYGRRELPPVMAQQISAFHETQRVRAATQRPAVAPAAQHHLHIHYHGTAQPEGMPAVLKAITEQQGEHS